MGESFCEWSTMRGLVLGDQECGSQGRANQLVESKTRLAKLENYDPCFSRTSSAFFAVTFCLR